MTDVRQAESFVTAIGNLAPQLQCLLMVFERLLELIKRGMRHTSVVQGCCFAARIADSATQWQRFR